MKNIILSSLLILMSCRYVKILDTSMSAVKAGDKTLIQSVCGNEPRQGLDLCRVIEGAPISQTWVVVLPSGEPIISGEFRVRYKDKVLSYDVPPSGVLEIKISDLIGKTYWELDDEAPIQGLATIRFKIKTGEAWADYLGLVFPMVLQKGYTPLPINSKEAGFKTKCVINYSTAGRSAVQCQQ